MNLKDMPMIGLARLAHRAEDTDDDLLLNEVMGEVALRDAADTYTSPHTGLTYPTGNPSRDFHTLYIEEMERRLAERRAKLTAVRKL